MTWVFENHDVTRIVTHFGGERQARAAALLLLALPGPVFERRVRLRGRRVRVAAGDGDPARDEEVDARRYPFSSAVAKSTPAKPRMCTMRPSAI